MSQRGHPNGLVSQQISHALFPVTACSTGILSLSAKFRARNQRLFFRNTQGHTLHLHLFDHRFGAGIAAGRQLSLKLSEPSPEGNGAAVSESASAAPQA